jgi:purine-cytosine permease-like protein
MELFTEFLSSLLKLSPIIGILMIVIYYLYKENKELKTKNEFLNNFVREEGIKNTSILVTVTHTLDKVIEQSEESMSHLKEWMDIKFKR